MILPATIFVAFGVIFAAIITGGISFINLIASKDQKTSEFRQKWIDALREDISEYLGNISILLVQSQIFFEKQSILNKNINLQNEVKYHEDDLKKEYAENIKSNLLQCEILYHKILFRLNIKDDELIIRSMTKIQNSYAMSLLSEPSLEEINKEKEVFSELIHKLLKKEWERVKKGEPSYYITKYIAIGISLLLLTMITLLLLGVLTIPMTISTT